MDGMRWLLLVIGLLVIGGVYLYTRRGGTRPPTASLRREPTLETDAGHEESESSSWHENAEFADEPDETAPAQENVTSPARAVPQKIVALRIIARGGGTFRGDEIILHLRGIGMRHGKFGIFHRLDGTDEGEAIFSAASLIEPGSFDLPNIHDQAIPGISLFAVLPGPVDGVEAFDMLIAAARTLAQSLDGELLDESGSTLSIQRERYMREEVVQFQHSHQIA